ncbi:LysE family translocator [Sulfitobacter sp. M368]|jgi:homoserine/homoserine lactone efflux protein|uniref:LysE family translocator n=1 Tax=Sulfitobacter sp. M368 TaxID=2867021 RepID=UPI0021A7BB60|nr:LysE family translocator [Sulfitobacter sp. M368]UWR13806.1 LysE family translocator [Sulfitobacter sp. M368]
MELAIWSVFLLTSLITTLSPGPNTLLVMVHSAKYGMRAGLLTITANLTSQLIFMTLVVYGFGAILAQTPLLYFAMKTIGALYLIYLGLKMLLNARSSSSVEVNADVVAAPPPSRRRFVEAFLVSSSNPKTVLFLAALLPQFLDPERMLAPQLAVMYLTNAIVILTIHLFYGYAARAVRGRIVSAKIKERIAHVTGLTFISLGAGLMASRSPS